MADIDFNVLGQVIDTSWGRSSTPRTAQQSVKLTMLDGNQLLASYAVVVNFGTERQMIEMKRRYETEAVDVTNEFIKRVKSSYKELCGHSLSIKELSSSNSIEIIGFNVHTARRTAYYRRKAVFEMS